MKKLSLQRRFQDLKIKEKIMNKNKDNNLVEPMDAIILLNDRYAEQGLKKGYIGVVVETLTEERKFILADFFNPFTGEDIASLAQIKKEDFRVISGSIADQKLVKAFKHLFEK